MITRKQAALAVTPFREYRSPRYPRAGEELAFDLDDVRAWPFSPTIAALVLSAATTIGCDKAAPAESKQPPAKAEPPPAKAEPPPAKAEQPPAKVGQPPAKAPATATPVAASARTRSRSRLSNPFAEVEPVRVGGKGGPSTLPEEVAVHGILQAFAKNGLRMRTNVALTRDGVTVSLDGYDATRRIGFEFITYDDRSPVNGPDDPRYLGAQELKMLRAEGEGRVALIEANDARFVYGYGVSRKEALQNLAKAVHSYLDFLRQEGAL